MSKSRCTVGGMAHEEHQTFEMEDKEAKRLAAHFISKGYWFFCEHREGMTEVTVDNDHDATSIVDRFHARLMT